VIGAYGSRAHPDDLGRSPVYAASVDVTFVFMMLVLKVPIVAMLWLVWWAVHAQPEPGSQHGEDGGGGPPVTQPPAPRRPGPRHRGPHGDPLPASPSRSRAPGLRLRRRSTPRP
jgi:hypothetical protein